MSKYNIEKEKVGDPPDMSKFKMNLPNLNDAGPSNVNLFEWDNSKIEKKEISLRRHGKSFKMDIPLSQRSMEQNRGLAGIGLDKSLSKRLQSEFHGIQGILMF